MTINYEPKSWNWWRDALAGKEVPLHDGVLHTGFYRGKKKGGTPCAVAIWFDSHDGSLRCQRDGQDMNEQQAMEMWPFIARNPITAEVYDLVVEQAQPWPDIDAIVHQHQQNETDDIAAQIEEATKSVALYATVTDDDMAGRAQTLRSHLLALAKKAKDAHAEEKAPFLERCREIDGKWLPAVKQAEGGAKKIRDANDAFATEKWRRQKAEEEAKLAQESWPSNEPPVTTLAPKPDQIRGASGKAASARPVKVVTGISDVEKLFGQFKTNQVVIEALMKCAQAAVNAGIVVEGVTIEDRVKTR